MGNEVLLWLALLVAGLLTFGQRLSFIVGWESLSLPPFAKRALRFVPISVLVALIVPDLLLEGETLALTLWNDRLLAGIFATVVAWKTSNILLTITSGMVGLLLLQTLV